jgi:hypothetical protein
MSYCIPLVVDANHDAVFICFSPVTCTDYRIGTFSPNSWYNSYVLFLLWYECVSWCSISGWWHPSCNICCIFLWHSWCSIFWFFLFCMNCCVGTLYSGSIFCLVSKQCLSRFYFLYGMAMSHGIPLVVDENHVAMFSCFFLYLPLAIV